jgi:D-alanine-D-alanine ligase-like ATP-grasp enzyme
MSMRICILSDESVEDYNPAPLLSGFDWEFVTVEQSVEAFIGKLDAEKKFDVYLNIYEGEDANDFSGADLIREMERLNLAFTGADIKFYSATREQMQSAADQYGVRFVRGFNAKTEIDLELAHELTFPLIAKHPNSFASEGLLPESRVSSIEELQAQFLRNQKEYGSARVEEFIEGREVTCLVVDNPEDLSAPFAYLPAEIKFPEGESFLHIEVKWFNWGTFIVPLEDAELIPRVQAVAKEMYLAMQGTGYARVDMRIRPNGEIVVLEINPNCGILYYGPDDRGPADLPISWDKDGHYGFIDRICKSAILRQKLRGS